MSQDPHHLIPRAIPAGSAIVRDVDLQVRTLVDYDVTYMRDRVVSEAFANGQPLGLRSVMQIPEGDLPFWKAPDVLQRYGPETEREVLRMLGSGALHDEVRRLDVHLQLLQAELVTLRESIRPWWRRTYDKVGSWISGVR